MVIFAPLEIRHIKNSESAKSEKACKEEADRCFSDKDRRRSVESSTVAVLSTLSWGSLPLSILTGRGTRMREVIRSLSRHSWCRILTPCSTQLRTIRTRTAASKRMTFRWRSIPVMVVTRIERLSGKRLIWACWTIATSSTTCTTPASQTVKETTKVIMAVTFRWIRISRVLPDLPSIVVWPLPLVIHVSPRGCIKTKSSIKRHTHNKRVQWRVYQISTSLSSSKCLQSSWQLSRAGRVCAASRLCNLEKIRGKLLKTIAA